MASLFTPPYFDVGAGITPADGALLNFYVVGSGTRKNTFPTAAATAGTEHENPVPADALGVFPAIYLVGDYDWVLDYKTGGQVNTGSVSEFATVANSTFIKNFATLAAAIADPNLVVDDALNLEERSEGNGGGAMWDVVLLSSVTVSTGAPTIGNVVAWGANSGAGTDLAFVLREGALDGSRWGADKVNSTDSTAAIELARAAAASGGKVHMENDGTFLCNLTGYNKNLSGNSYATKLKTFDNASPVITLGVHTPDHVGMQIDNFTIDGNAYASHGIDYGTEYVNGRVVRNTEIKSCNYGIHKGNGQLETFYDTVHFFGNQYGYRAAGDASLTRHAGTDLFLNCEFDNNVLAAVYIDSDLAGTGQTRFLQTIMQGNPGFGLFVNEWNTSFTPLVLDGVWFETNAVATTVTIDGIVRTPRDAYFGNTAQAIITKSRIGDGGFETNRGQVYCEQSFASDDSPLVVKTIHDSFIFADCYTNSWKGERVESIIGFSRKAGNFADVLDTQPRKTIRNTNQPWHSGTLVMGNDFSNAATYTFPGSTSRVGVTRADGVIFDSCCELTLQDGDIQLFDSMTIVADKYYCWSIDIQRLNVAEINVNMLNAVTLVSAIATGAVEDEWHCYAGCTYGDAGTAGTASLNLTNTSGVAASIRLSAFQVMEFDNRQDCIDYFRAGLFTTENRPSRFFTDAMPTAGSWIAGAFAENTASASYTPDGNNMLLTGWRRATTGSNNVLGTDWFAVYLSTVTPAT
jgi:hypothetical protein